MKTIFIIACTFFLSASVAAQHDMKDMPGMKMEKPAVKKPVAKKIQSNSTQKVIYTCVMHPEVKMDKPGNCPKCGMKLVKKTVAVSTPKVAVKKPQNNAATVMASDKHDMKGMDMQMECAALCYASAQLMSLGSDKAKEVCRICADLCEACGNECGQHASHSKHCQECAEACKACAEECRKMAA